MLTRHLLAALTLAACLVGGVAAQEKKAPAQPQATVASKTATFATIPASDPAVARALKATDLEGARKLIGKEGAFEGKVVALYSPASNGIVILNFDRNFRNAISAVLRVPHYAAFPDMQSLKNQRVLISGKFEDYQGRVEIILTKPEQVKRIQ